MYKHDITNNGLWTYPRRVEIGVVREMKNCLIMIVPGQFALKRELVKEIQAIEGHDSPWPAL